MNKKIILPLLILLLSFSLHSARLMRGDKDAPEGTTFSFGINKNIMSSSGNFYEGAHEIVTTSPEFTLSRLLRDAIAFMPLTPETVTLNGSTAENPLFGEKIIALGMLETEDHFFIRDMPIVVGASKPAKVYLFEDIEKLDNIIIISSMDVHDATGAVSSGIVNLTTNLIGHVFAAVKPQNGEFGDINSGIALLVRGVYDTAEGTKQRIFNEINANNGQLEIDPTTHTQIPPKALRLDVTSPALFINSDLAHIVNNQIALHWDNKLERLFVGLQVVSNTGTNDGARSVAIIKFKEDGGIELQEIAPVGAFAPKNIDSIIGVIGANQALSINTLDTMLTSTALSYLIVVGGNGNPSAHNNSVFALPLVNTGDDKGMIAQKNFTPVNIFRDANVPRLIARNVNKVATTESEMTQATDAAAQVGGGLLGAGPIVNIIVRSDTVFAYVANTDPNADPGVYSSQALFDASGKIKGWTNWQRAAGTTDNIFAAALNTYDGNFILASGDDADEVDTIERTIWSDGSPESLQPLTAILDAALSADNGGVQGLQTFLPFGPGIQNIALLAAGGIGTVVLAQTGIINTHNTIIPTTGGLFNNMVEFQNGTITSNVNANTVVISGGALDTVGPITALEIGRNASNGWLFVGGSNGLAILAQSNGMGWNPNTQLSINLTGLQKGMSFTIIGDYSFVKKLIYNNGFLYVLTHDRVDRINLATSNFGTNTLDVTTIASVGHNDVSNYGGFLDGIFSQALGILATTNALLRIGDNKDVRTVTNESDAQWTVIPIGENAGAPTALYAMTQTNRLQDITRNNGGQFYVLSGDVGSDQSRLNRFAVQPLGATDTVNSTTIQSFDDLFVKNIPSFLLSFGEFRSNFATDGALYFATRNQNVDISPIALLTPGLIAPTVGVNGVGDHSAQVAINFQQGTEINYFARSQASGSWIAAGNFNTQVLE